MQLLNTLALDEFKQKHPDARVPLDAWRKEVEAANWQTPQDIKNRYRHADFLSKNRVIFDIKGNGYRLVAVVRYIQKMVVVEWLGTHSEYDKKKFDK